MASGWEAAGVVAQACGWMRARWPWLDALRCSLCGRSSTRRNLRRRLDASLAGTAAVLSGLSEAGLGRVQFERAQD